MVNFLKTGNVEEKTDVERAAELKIQLKKVLLGELPDSDMPANMMKRKKKRKKDIPKFERPPDDIWVIERPKISALQDDIIKLSAQFRARNGRVFEVGLLNRESKNSQFAFLHPYHPLHSYFKKLVQSYTRCLIPERETIQSLHNTEENPDVLVEKLLNRVYYERSQNQKDEVEEVEKKKKNYERSIGTTFLSSKQSTMKTNQQ